MFKTIGDLRAAIKDNGGVLKIGHMEIRTDDGQDIDFLYKSNLFQWISSTHPDESELGYTSGSMDAQVVEYTTKETIKEVEKVVEKVMPDPKQSGIIEAYEKILFGRKITLEN